uniref:Uncharacterized protein n=1 Tax=Haptolina brevifila TaxID=156173 RepID=A0A7S2N9I5_9EUKA|mmetsp:Transcript_70603/g.139935  ORF Transcript_70603/g.139935 Transcript_70603/m.139935 type:complete len:128 (+) Transcript_70603:424-807(+)
MKLTAAAAAAQALPLRTGAFDAACTATPLPAGDVILLSDLFVTNTLARIFAGRVAEALSAGKCILVVDPGRSSRASFLDELERHDVRHNGFQRPDKCLTKDAGFLSPSAGRLWLLDTDEGAPISYDI